MLAASSPGPDHATKPPPKPARRPPSRPRRPRRPAAPSPAQHPHHRPAAPSRSSCRRRRSSSSTRSPSSPTCRRCSSNDDARPLPPHLPGPGRRPVRARPMPRSPGCSDKALMGYVGAQRLLSPELPAQLRRARCLAAGVQRPSRCAGDLQAGAGRAARRARAS